MPVSFIVSLVVFGILLVFLVAFEYRYRKISQKTIEEVEKNVVPAAKATNEIYKRKFGRPCTEITATFPELNTPKSA